MNKKETFSRIVSMEAYFNKILFLFYLFFLKEIKMKVERETRSYNNISKTHEHERYLFPDHFNGSLFYSNKFIEEAEARTIFKNLAL